MPGLSLRLYSRRTWGNSQFLSPSRTKSGFEGDVALVPLELHLQPGVGLAPPGRVSEDLHLAGPHLETDRTGFVSGDVCHEAELAAEQFRVRGQGVLHLGGDHVGVAGEVALDEPREHLGVLRAQPELFLREPEGNDLVLTACAGADTNALAERSRFELGVGFPGLVVSSGKPIGVQGDLATDRRFLRPGIPQAGIRSYACVPLLERTGALGSLHLLSRRRDFPVDTMIALLEQAAIPITNAVRAGLAALRQAIDAACGGVDGDAPEPALRSLLESMLSAAGCRHGALALVDPETGKSGPVITSGPTSTLCSVATAGTWRSCRNAVEGHGFAAEPGRRQWPDACRRGLPPRMARPCCLPMVSQGRFHGLISLDFGRQDDVSAISRVVPLLTMAHQAATRLEARRPGFEILQSAADSSVACTDPGHADLMVRCLGPFTIIQRGQAISAETFPRIKALSLLKMLALKGGAPINRDVLIERLWPDADPHAGANRLHGVVHALRSVIEPHRAERRWIYVRNHGDVYYLDTHASVDIDVSCFRDHVERGMEGEGPDAVTELEAAARLYRGDLFEGDPYSEWCEDERRELREDHSNALKRLAELHADAGNAEAALSSLQRALRFEPLRDDLHLALMELFADLKRRSEALAHYDEYERQLQAELGVPPPPELQALRRSLAGPPKKK